jgi:hypothetical protein
VADAFVELPAPEEGLLVLPRPEVAQGAVVGGDLGPDGEQLLDDARHAVVAEIDAAARVDPASFEHAGILLQTLGDRLRQAVPSLPVARSAYPGLKEFLQWATVDTRYCVFRRTDAQERVTFSAGLRSSVPGDATVLPALERRPPQVSNPVGIYRLLASQGKPLLRLPEPEVAAQVLRCLAARGVSGEDLTSVINDVADQLDGTVSTADVKNLVVMLARSGTLKGDPADAPLPDRIYSLAAASATAAALREAVLSVVRDKLESRLGTIDAEVLERLVER